MAPAKQLQRGRSGGKTAPPPPSQPQHQQQQEQLDCWACDATVAVPLDPGGTGRLVPAFSCGWCGAVTRVEEEEERENQGGEQQQLRRRARRQRLSASRRLLARVLLPLASALSIAAATFLGVGWVLPALFNETKHPWLLLAADALAALVSFNVAVHFCALVSQAAGVFGRIPKRVVVAAAGVGRTPEDEDTVSVSFSGDSCSGAFSGGSVCGGGGGSASAAAVFVGSSVPRGAYAGHERCELCVEAAARRSSEEKKKRRWRSGREEILAFRPFPAPPPPPPPRASFSSWRKRGHRPPGAAHCLVCDVCVADVDHHCSFVGTCVSLRAGGKGQGEGGEQQQEHRRSQRHHASGRHFALLLFWLLAGSLYAALGSTALLVSRRGEVGDSLRRVASSLLLLEQQGKTQPLLLRAAATPPPPPQRAAVRWRLGKAPQPAKATTVPLPPPPRSPSRSRPRSRAAALLLVLLGTVPLLLIASPPWISAALGLAALGAATAVGVACVAADAARRVAAGESAADERRRQRTTTMAAAGGGAGAVAPPRPSLFESLSDLFGGGNPNSWLLPPWGNDDGDDEKEE